MRAAWEIVGGIGAGMLGFGVLVALLWWPIAHWRALADDQFPLGGLTRSQWKLAWLVSIFACGTLLLGGLYWWLWWARKNERARAA